MKLGRNAPCPCGSGRKYKRCCLEKPFGTNLLLGADNTLILIDETDATIPRLTKGGRQVLYGVEVWIPRLAVQVSVRSAAEVHLRQRYDQGEYRGRAQVNEILQHMFAYYDDVVRQELGAIMSRDALDFVLFQNEQWAEVYLRSRLGTAECDDDEREFVESHGGIMRRGLKYILELMCQASEHSSDTAESSIWRMEKVLIASEELAMLAQVSSQTYSLFPDSTTIDILPTGHEPYMGLRIEPADEDRINSYRYRYQAWERAVDTAQRAVYNSLLTDVVKAMPDAFDAAFKKDLGFTFTDIIRVLESLKTGVTPAAQSFTPFVLKRELVQAIASHLDMPVESVIDILDAFTITPSSLSLETPEIWRPKRHRRVLRRPLLEIPHSLGTHLAYGPNQLSEAQLVFANELQKRRLPAEWTSRPLVNVRKTLELLHKRANQRLEEVALEQLQKRGFIGIRGVRSGRLRTADGCKIHIPDRVGEIDLLCVDPQHRVLLVGECKNVSFASEPSLWYDDLQDFILKRDSYCSKFSRKVEWVRELAYDVIEAIATEFGVPIAGPWSIAPVLITTHETFAASYSTDFPCVSLAVVLHEYDAAMQWPFGRFIIPLSEPIN